MKKLILLLFFCSPAFASDQECAEMTEVVGTMHGIANRSTYAEYMEALEQGIAELAKDDPEFEEYMRWTAGLAWQFRFEDKRALQKRVNDSCYKILDARNSE